MYCMLMLALFSVKAVAADSAGQLLATPNHGGGGGGGGGGAAAHGRAPDTFGTIQVGLHTLGRDVDANYEDNKGKGKSDKSMSGKGKPKGKGKEKGKDNDGGKAKGKKKGAGVAKGDWCPYSGEWTVQFDDMLEFKYNITVRGHVDLHGGWMGNYTEWGPTTGRLVTSSDAACGGNSRCAELVTAVDDKTMMVRTFFTYTGNTSDSIRDTEVHTILIPINMTISNASHTVLESVNVSRKTAPTGCSPVETPKGEEEKEKTESLVRLPEDVPEAHFAEIVREALKEVDGAGEE